MTPEDPLLLLASLSGEAWLVGGALRDRLLGRPTADYDVAVAGDPGRLARAFARRAGGHAFVLSEGFGGWRVVARTRDWQVDLLPVAGGGIEADLAARDFTVNALALPLGGEDNALPVRDRETAPTLPLGDRESAPALPLGAHHITDPFGGLADLEARRLRMVSAEALQQDPLRTMRLIRLSCELAFRIDDATREAARRNVGRLGLVAAERVFHELKRIVCCDRAVEGLDALEAIGATGIVLPELEAMRGVSQSPYHHLDVYEHTRAVLGESIALARDPGSAFAEHAEAVRAVLEEPLADELTRGEALRFGALFHDIAKPQTRAVVGDGRVTFIGHDAAGAALVGQVLARLRASERLRQHVAALTEHHLALGFMVHRAPLMRREVYEYLKRCEPVQVDVTVLSVADRLATRGEGSDRAIHNHLALARQLVGEALAWMAAPPRPPIRGDELARRLGMRPGPELGRVLEELREASFAGEVHTPEEALQLAARLQRGGDK